jgi:DNA-binding MarR family transcriptional regulator
MALVRELHGKTFASRLKRLGDRLKTEATRVYHQNGIEFNDSWFLVAVALSRQDRIAVTEIAEELGISHAAVSQIAAAMKDKGLVGSEPDSSDGRKTLIHLTEHGKSTVETLEPIWEAIGDCAEELIESTGQDLLGALTLVEEQLKERSLCDRVSHKLQQPTRK